MGKLSEVINKWRSFLDVNQDQLDRIEKDISEVSVLHKANIHVMMSGEVVVPCTMEEARDWMRITRERLVELHAGRRILHDFIILLQDIDQALD